MITYKKKNVAMTSMRKHDTIPYFPGLSSHAWEAYPQSGKASREYRATAASKGQPKCSEEFGTESANSCVTPVN